MSVRKPLLLSALVGAVVLSPAAAGDKSFVLPFLLQFEDGTAAIGWDASGGQPGVHFTVDIAGPIVTAVAMPVSSLWPIGDSRPMLEWVAKSFAPDDPPLLNIRMLTAQREATTKASNVSQITSVEFPGCDSELKESRGIKMEIESVEVKHLGAHEAAHVIQQAAKKQKMWTCSNFRLRVGDLPTGNTIRTEKIKFKQEFGPTQAQKKTLHLGEGESMQLERLPVTISDFAFEIPSADRRRADEEMVKALDGNPSLLTVQLDYLDENGETLLTLRFPATIKAVGQAPIFADPPDPDVPVRVVLQPLNTSPTTGNLEIIIK